MIVVGVDPGVSGALVALDTDLDVLSVCDMPVCEVKTSTGKTRLEMHDTAVADWLRAVSPDRAVLELVGAAPGQGVVSMFRFGLAFGVVRGVLAALQIPVTLVTPNTWRRAMRVPEGKDGSRLRASQLFPRNSQEFRRVKDHGRADAALLAAYGASSERHLLRGLT